MSWIPCIALLIIAIILWIQLKKWADYCRQTIDEYEAWIGQNCGGSSPDDIPSEPDPGWPS